MGEAFSPTLSTSLLKSIALEAILDKGYVKLVGFDVSSKTGILHAY